MSTTIIDFSAAAKNVKKAAAPRVKKVKSPTVVSEPITEIVDVAVPSDNKAKAPRASKASLKKAIDAVSEPAVAVAEVETEKKGRGRPQLDDDRAKLSCPHCHRKSSTYYSRRSRAEAKAKKLAASVGVVA